MPMYFAFVDTTVGRLLAAADDVGLRRLSFVEPSVQLVSQPGWVEEASRFAGLSRQLAGCLPGPLRGFDRPLAPGGTAG